MKNTATKEAYERLRVTGSVMTADIIFPGFKAGVELPLIVGVTNRRTKRRNKLKNGVGELFLTATGGTWVDPRNAVPVFALAELGTRWTNHIGGHIALHAGLGYVHQFNGSASFHVNDDNDVRSAPIAGHPGLLITGALSFGHDISKLHRKIPLSIALKPGIYTIVPFNTGILPGALLELTFTGRLGGST